jgi:hypothetical protein
VSDLAISGNDKIATFSRACWTIANRAMTYNVCAPLLAVSLMKQSGLSNVSAYRICCNDTSVNGGPVMSRHRSVTVMWPQTEVLARDTPRHLHSYASYDYIKSVAGTVTNLFSPDIVTQLNNTFKNASYRKAMITGFSTAGIRCTQVNIDTNKTSVDMNLLSLVHEGVLSKHPTLPSLQNTLTIRELSVLLFAFTGKSHGGNMNISDYLFGAKTNVVASFLGMNFDDLSQLGRLDYFKRRDVGATLYTHRLCFF